MTCRGVRTDRHIRRPVHGLLPRSILRVLGSALQVQVEASKGAIEVLNEVVLPINLVNARLRFRSLPRRRPRDRLSPSSRGMLVDHASGVGRSVEEVSVPGGGGTAGGSSGTSAGTGGNTGLRARHIAMLMRRSGIDGRRVVLRVVMVLLRGEQRSGVAALAVSTVRGRAAEARGQHALSRIVGGLGYVQRRRIR